MKKRIFLSNMSCFRRARLVGLALSVFLCLSGCGRTNEIPSKISGHNQEILVQEEKTAQLFQEYEKGNIEITAEDIRASAGSDIEVPVQIVQSDGIAGIRLEISYDNSILKFIALDLVQSYTEYLELEECSEIPKSNIVRATYLFKQNVFQTGTFVMARFRVKTDTVGGQRAAVNVNVQEAVQADGTQISCNESCCYVIVE